MCNGYRHEPGCTCGWGGEGHLGGGRVGHPWAITDSSASERAKHWHNKPMSQLAAELGHSVLFPVQCRYCGDDIYLFADPNGGFAMFNDVGRPWPKHRCPGMSNVPVPYHIPPITFSPNYDMPVPMNVWFAPYDAGRKLQGTVVQIRPTNMSRFKGDVTDVVLYNGRRSLQKSVPGKCFRSEPSSLAFRGSFPGLVLVLAK